MRVIFYKILVVIFALLNLKPPDYVDHYGRRYRISKNGTWMRKNKALRQELSLRVKKLRAT
jgi:hypothetical protein